MSYRSAIYKQEIPEFARKYRKRRYESAIFHEEIISLIVNRQSFEFVTWKHFKNVCLPNPK